MLIYHNHKLDYLPGLAGGFFGAKMDNISRSKYYANRSIFVLLNMVKDENIAKLAEALSTLAQSFKNESENCAKMCGDISEKETAVIFFVGQNKNVKMSDIADNITAPMSTLTSIVDKLVEKNYLTRGHSGEDRRVINVSLSSAGKTAYNKLVAKRKKLAESILSGLDEKEQAQMTKYLKLLSTKIGAAQ